MGVGQVNSWGSETAREADEGEDEPIEPICEGRVAVVTGGGRGLGREHALELARQGARVVVNDTGCRIDGTGHDERPALAVVDEVRALGGEAVANHDDVADWKGAKRMVDQAVDTFGGLDVVVNNAGILRDRMVVNLTDLEWDAVVNVHLRGTFALTHFAAAHWRDQFKAGARVDGRVVNTVSSAGLFGNAGQANYAAAKAAVAAVTVVAAKELARYGVTVNAVSPRSARTRMTERAGTGVQGPPEGFDPYDPATVSPMVAWLASTASRHVTGQVFEVVGGTVTLLEGWRRGPQAERPRRWSPAELGPVVENLIAASSR
jgi:NAD(P)-dependent dehydrogenase (short-subunit alcohol dehydrogenase family)